MVNIKTWSIRIIMIILFTIAFLTTFQTITGVKAQVITIGNEHSVELDRKNEKMGAGVHSTKSTQVGLKTLNESVRTETKISSSEEINGQVPPLEEAFNWEEKYPSQTVVATGYTAGYESTGKNPDHPSYGITYSGVKVKRDLYSTIAADLNVFPVGTILFIPGYGFGVVADKGAAIKGNKIDLYFETVQDVYNEWGKKTIEVYVVKMGEGKLTSTELDQLNEDKTMQVFRQQFGFKTEE